MIGWNKDIWADMICKTFAVWKLIYEYSKTQRFQKIIYLNLFKGSFMNLDLSSIIRTNTELNYISIHKPLFQEVQET